MTGGASLAHRVVAYLIVAQLVAFVIAIVVTNGLGLAHFWIYELTLDSLATDRTKDLVIESLSRAETGEIRIDPSSRLRTELERAPSLKYAAFDSRFTPVQGSSVELAEFLAAAIRVNSSHTHFVLPSDPLSTPKGYAAPELTPVGMLQIAVYGQKFRWDDIFYATANEFQWSAIHIVSATIVSILTAWFAVRHGLAPLRAVSLDAARINMDSLDQRLAIDRLPTEVAPLVAAMNSALARLDASAKRWRRYTANTAHELRTPLAIMRARLEDVEEPTFKTDLLRDASHLQAIVEQMLIAARLTENQVPLDQNVDLATTIRPLVSRYLPLAWKCHRTLEFESGDGPVLARGNQRAIECAVANLVDNALRAEPAGGTVLVRVSENAVIEVIDHGDGVAPADHEMIFEPFWRKHDVSSGAGLGLAITKELVEKQQGRIWVEETPSGGATFKVSLLQPNAD
jgi:signal transduction histidine kinase